MNAPYFLEHIWLIPLFPLLTAAVMLFYGRKLANNIVSYLCAGSVFVSFIFSVGAFLQLVARPEGERFFTKMLFQWLPAIPYHMFDGRLANFVASWEFQIDPLSAVMILVVTGVGFLIHVYSTGYMAHEGGYYRFFGYLNLFMFAMLILVLANNFLMMFVGWEGVGTCSYLLIGFYFHRKSASDAGKKAFIVNRVGDAGFLLGIFLCSAVLGTVRFSDIGPALLAGHLQQRNRRQPRLAHLELSRQQRRPDIAEAHRSQHRRAKKNSQQESRVTHAVHNKRLFSRVRRRFPVKIKSDQQIAACPDAFPAHKHHQEIIRQHQNQHRKHEQIQIPKKPVIPALVRHVSRGIHVNQESHSGDHQNHHRGKRINLKFPAGHEIRQPAVKHVIRDRGQPLEKHLCEKSLAFGSSHQLQKRAHRKNKRDKHATRAQIAYDVVRELTPVEQHRRRRQQREQRDQPDMLQKIRRVHQ